VFLLQLQVIERINSYRNLFDFFLRLVVVNRTVARKFSIGGLCVSAGGFGFVRGA